MRDIRKNHEQLAGDMEGIEHQDHVEATFCFYKLHKYQNELN